MKRESGHYWVRLIEVPLLNRIGYYHELPKTWDIIGISEVMEDYQVQVISGKLDVPPAPIKTIQEFYDAVLKASNDKYTGVIVETDFERNIKCSCWCVETNNRYYGATPEAAIESMKQALSTKKNDIGLAKLDHIPYDDNSNPAKGTEFAENLPF